MEKKYIDTYEKCVLAWGVDSQIKMCIEEMSELTKEFCKYYRNGEMNCNDEQKRHIMEEIADVQNMVDQMQYIFGEKQIDEIRDYKINRVKKILLEEEQK